jgi:hypothetical protein
MIVEMIDMMIDVMIVRTTTAVIQGIMATTNHGPQGSQNCLLLSR